MPCEQNLILKKLPYDPMRFIFKLLDRNDLIRLRRVCKTFRSVVNSIKPRELIVLSGWRGDVNGRWLSYKEPAYLSNSIRARISSAFGEDQLVLRSSGFQMLGTNLRFLSLDFTVRTSHLEDFLNFFARLEELNI